MAVTRLKGEAGLTKEHAVSRWVPIPCPHTRLGGRVWVCSLSQLKASHLPHPCRDDGSRTPLHWAAAAGLQDVLATLLDAAAARYAAIVAALRATAEAAAAAAAAGGEGEDAAPAAAPAIPPEAMPTHFLLMQVGVLGMPGLLSSTPQPSAFHASKPVHAMVAGRIHALCASHAMTPWHMAWHGCRTPTAAPRCTWPSSTATRAAWRTC